MRNTKQKEIIYKSVTTRCDHPTAEMIYSEVKGVLPQISLATVYRNLSQLSEQGKIKRIAVPSAPDRFDKTVSQHSHFICSECNSVFDLDFQEVDSFVKSTAEKHGCIIEKIDILFAGKCKKCINKTNIN